MYLPCIRIPENEMENILASKFKRSQGLFKGYSCKRLFGRFFITLTALPETILKTFEGQRKKNL
jgi:hypothetical protein